MIGLEKFLSNTDMEFGSKNYDDDFHTDVVFYRASCRYIKDYIGTCHDQMIAFHNIFVSTFYYSKEKTKFIAQKVLNLLENDEDFFSLYEEKYRDACEKLEQTWEIEDFNELDLYKRQYFCQQEMYKYCWPFEILQTEFGIEYYLINSLSKEGYSEEQIKNILYQSELNNENIYFLEKYELNKLCLKIKNDLNLKRIFENDVKHIVMLLPHDLKTNIKTIMEKYKYLYYHGFSDRKLPNLYDYVLKIKKALISPFYFEEDKKELGLVFPKNIQRVLHCYSKLSALKSIRRLAQLKNFYYLDKLIEKIAEKNNIPESFIRYMTPEEVILLCETGKYDSNIESRVNGMIYLFDNGEEKIYTNVEDMQYLENILCDNSNIKKDIFQGKIACRGYAKGPIMKILRPSDAEKINKKVIIFTHEGDPDLLTILHKAKAIVCEQGGITCHMAVIAREFGIPCIIGVGNNVLNSFKNNEIVEVDAINGYIKRSKV